MEHFWFYLNTVLKSKDYVFKMSINNVTNYLLYTVLCTLVHVFALYFFLEWIGSVFGHPATPLVTPLSPHSELNF